MENWTLEEIIKYINDQAFTSIYDIEDECEEFNALDPERVAAGLEVDQHRWYEISVTVFKIGERFLGLYGVTKTYSESMSLDDCGIAVRAFEVEPVETITYRRKK